jgi:hypothetical protein
MKRNDVHEKRICASLPSFLSMAWSWAKKPRPTIERDWVVSPISGRAQSGERDFHCRGRFPPLELNHDQCEPTLPQLNPQHLAV